MSLENKVEQILQIVNGQQTQINEIATAVKAGATTGTGITGAVDLSGVNEKLDALALGVGSVVTAVDSVTNDLATVAAGVAEIQSQVDDVSTLVANPPAVNSEENKG